MIKMKRVYAAIVSLPLILAGCGEMPPSQPQEPLAMKLRGMVFSEKYEPPRKVSFGVFYRGAYSFSMDTDLGRKGIQVEATREVNRETLDALIEPGTRVEIEIWSCDKGSQVYTLAADKIHVLSGSDTAK